MESKHDSIRDLAIRAGGKAHWTPKELATVAEAIGIVVQALELADADPAATDLVRDIWRGWMPG